MKKRAIVAALIAAALLTGASEWEGSAVVAGTGELPDSGFYIATNSFPRNTVVDVKNLETDKSIRVIVAAGLDAPGLLAALSSEAASAIGMERRSVGKIRVTVPADPAAFSRFMDGSGTSPDPDRNPRAAFAQRPATPPAEAPVPSQEAPIATAEPVVETTVEIPEDFVPPAPLAEAESEPEETVQAIVEAAQEPAAEEPLAEEPPIEIVEAEAPAAEEPPVEIVEVEAPAAEEPAAEEPPIEIVEAEAPAAEETPPEIAVAEVPEVVAVPEPGLESKLEAFAEPAPEEPAPEIAAEEPEEGPQASVLSILPESDTPEISLEESPEPVEVESAENLAPAPAPETAAAETSIIEEPLLTVVEEAAPETVTEEPPTIVETPAAEAPEALALEDAVLEEPTLEIVEPEAVVAEAPAAEEMPEMAEAAAPATAPAEGTELVIDLVPAEERPPAVVQEEPAPESILPELEISPIEQSAPIAIPAPEEPILDESLFIEPAPTLVLPLEPAPVPEAPVVDEPAPSVPAVAAAPARIVAPLIETLEKDKYYLQIGAFGQADAINDVIARLGGKYPAAVQPGGSPDKPVYRLFVGPVNQGESGALLIRFKQSGYPDAFIKKGI